MRYSVSSSENISHQYLRYVRTYLHCTIPRKKSPRPKINNEYAHTPYLPFPYLPLPSLTLPYLHSDPFLTPSVPVPHTTYTTHTAITPFNTKCFVHAYLHLSVRPFAKRGGGFLSFSFFRFFRRSHVRTDCVYRLCRCWWNTLFSVSGGVDRVFGLGWAGRRFFLGWKGLGGLVMGSFSPVVCGVGLDWIG